MVGNRYYPLHSEATFMACLVWDLRTPPKKVCDIKAFKNTGYCLQELLQ